MTTLTQHINVLSQKGSVELFLDLFSKPPKETTGWLTGRIISVEGYQGFETLDKIATVFASTLRKAPHLLSLQDRLTYLNLSERLRIMYQSKPKHHKETFFQKVLENQKFHTPFLYFTNEEYQKYCPDVEPFNRTLPMICTESFVPHDLGPPISFFKYEESISGTPFCIVSIDQLQALVEKERAK